MFQTSRGLRMQARDLPDVSQVRDSGDRSILQQAFVHMQNPADHVVANPDQQVLPNYFSPIHAQDVQNVLRTAQSLASPGGVQGLRPSWQHLGPSDLNEITIARDGPGCAGENLSLKFSIDDQDGRFPCTSKAHDPFKATRLRQGNITKARLNNENYVCMFSGKIVVHKTETQETH
ncbi:MAG: hypothetical protein Q9209_004382 [Squamulea sp. 1 TL-2023]